MLTFQIAFRNIMRQKRRSLLTGLSMTGGYMLFVLGYSLLEGSYGNIIDNTMHNTMGHCFLNEDGADYVASFASLVAPSYSAPVPSALATASANASGDARFALLS